MIVRRSVVGLLAAIVCTAAACTRVQGDAHAVAALAATRTAEVPSVAWDADMETVVAGATDVLQRLPLRAFVTFKSRSGTVVLIGRLVEHGEARLEIARMTASRTKVTAHVIADADEAVDVAVAWSILRNIDDHLCRNSGPPVTCQMPRGEKVTPYGPLRY